MGSLTRGGRSGPTRATRSLVIFLITIGLSSVAGATARAPHAAAAPTSAAAAHDRVHVTLGPVEVLADRSGSALDDTAGAILARGIDGPTAIFQEWPDAPIDARERLPDATWSAVQNIPCVGPGDAKPPRFCHVAGTATGADGELVALLDTWSRPRGPDVAVSVRRAGESTWSKAKLLSGAYRVGGGGWNPTIRSSRGGGTLVTFAIGNVETPSLIAAYVPPGQSWADASYHTLPDAEWPVVSGLSRDGSAVVIYTNRTGLDSPVLAARFLPNRGFTKPTRMGSGWTQNWSAAMGPGGRAVATWMETTTDSSGQSITRRHQRVRLMTAAGKWGRPRVVARGGATDGVYMTWVRGEVGVAWANSVGVIRVSAKALDGPWQTSTIARGDMGGHLRSLDINATGDLALTWENWRQANGYSLVLALRPHGGQWTAPRRVYTDVQNGASGSVLAQHAGAVVSYGDDVLRQVVARRAKLDANP